MSLRRLTNPRILRGTVLFVLLLTTTSGCSGQPQRVDQFSAGTAVSVNAPYYGGIQEVGIIGQVKLPNPGKQLKDKDGFKIDCLVTFIPKFNFLAPKDGDLGESVTAASPSKRGSTGPEWCRGLRSGAGYLVFWDPQANIHFTQFGQRPAGGKELVESGKRAKGRYCRITFIGPDLTDKPYIAGPFPGDYCDAIKAK